MTGHELVPEPDVLHGTRPNQEYRDMIAGRIDQAYAENIIGRDERDARAAALQRARTTTDDLRTLTRDLPEPAAPVPWPPARVRLMAYILAGFGCAGVAIGLPTAVITMHLHITNPLIPLATAFGALLAIAGVVCAIAGGFTDKVVAKEYG